MGVNFRSLSPSERDFKTAKDPTQGSAGQIGRAGQELVNTLGGEVGKNDAPEAVAIYANLPETDRVKGQDLKIGSTNTLLARLLKTLGITGGEHDSTN